MVNLVFSQIEPRYMLHGTEFSLVIPVVISFCQIENNNPRYP